MHCILFKFVDEIFSFTSSLFLFSYLYHSLCIMYYVFYHPNHRYYFLFICFLLLEKADKRKVIKRHYNIFKENLD